MCGGIGGMKGSAAGLRRLCIAAIAAVGLALLPATASAGPISVNTTATDAFGLTFKYKIDVPDPWNGTLVLVLDHRVGASAGIRGPETGPRYIRHHRRHPEANHRLGTLAGRHDHSRARPAVPQSIHGRTAHVRSSSGRTWSVEPRSGLGVCAGRPPVPLQARELHQLR